MSDPAVSQDMLHQLRVIYDLILQFQLLQERLFDCVEDELARRAQYSAQVGTGRHASMLYSVGGGYYWLAGVGWLVFSWGENLQTLTI